MAREMMELQRAAYHARIAVQKDHIPVDSITVGYMFPGTAPANAFLHNLLHEARENHLYYNIPPNQPMIFPYRVEIEGVIIVLDVAK
jgi:hypothetical protein